jgi:hypothetical protein
MHNDIRVEYVKTLRLLALLLATSVVACSDPPAEPAEPVQSAPAEAAPPTRITAENQGILTDTQRDGLNGANQASALLQQAEEERRKQLEEQTR